MTSAARQQSDDQREQPVQLSDRFPEKWLLALNRVALLTPRERRVFELLSASPTYEDVAREIFISERTVRAHVSAIQRKLVLNSKVQVCTASALHGLIAAEYCRIRQ
jgi:DNA-binding NarL/FixJ family response regulator